MIRRLVIGLACAAGVLLAGSCGDTTTTPPNQLNLDRPIDIAFACYGGLRITNGQAASPDQAVVFSSGWAEFAFKNPPPLVPSSLMASCEAIGPMGSVCV